jgi:chaperonin cofactor prefoldin
MKRMMLVWLAGGLLAGAPVRAQDVRTDVAALRNEVARLGESQRQLLARMEELQTALAQARAPQADPKVAVLEQKAAALEQQVATLTAALAQESQARQKANDDLVKSLAKELAGTRRPPAGGGGAGGGDAVIDPGYELREIEVQKGDSLSVIARAAGTTVEKIKQINGLTSDALRLGQKLKVPVKK